MNAPTLDSRISAVTVYRQGALVTRCAPLRLGDGAMPTAVMVEGLPMLADDGSVRVEIRGRGQGARPTATDVRMTVTVPAADPQAAPATNEALDEAEEAVAVAQQREHDLSMMHQAVLDWQLTGRGRPAEGEPPIPSPTAARAQLLDLRRQQLSRLGQQLREATEQLREATEHRDTLAQRQALQSSAKNPRAFEARKAALIGLTPADAPHDDDLEIVVQYFVHGARWTPFYVLRLDEGLSQGRLEQRVLVAQATAEDWADVELELSTAKPQQWTDLPTLQSLRLGRRQSYSPKRGWRPPPSGGDDLYQDYDRALAPGRDMEPPPKPRKATRARPEPGPYAPPPTGAAPPPGRQAAPPPAAAPAAPPAPTAAPQGPAAPAAMSMASRGKLQELSPDADMFLEPESRSRSAWTAVFGAARSGAAPAGAPLGGGGPGQQAPGGAPEQAPVSRAETLTADRSLLDYQRLHVASADEPHRGTLRPATDAQLYGHLGELSSEHVEHALRHAEQQRAACRALELRAPPPQHQWAKATDGFDYAYPVGARVDVPSDGELHAIVVGQPEVSLTPRYITVPRETQDVFRVLAMRNPIDAPLLPGPVDVYVDGRFMLAAPLPTTAPRGRVELGLGVEQAIKVARNVAFDDEASGLLKRHRDLEHRIEIELANRLAHDATIEVRERVPIPRNEDTDIEIEEHEIEPPWDEYEPPHSTLEGGRKWTVTVAAGSTKTLRARWSIRIPQSQQIVGGNRREG